jgi:Ca-activated chloride channel family protein
MSLRLLIACLFYCTAIHAFDFHSAWKNLWQTPDQQGMKLMNQHRYQQAAQTFQDPLWQAAAAYRQGDYKKAEQLYRLHADDTSLYNLGNSLAQLKQYQPAIDAYQQVLKHNPNHQDARFNKALIEKLLQENPPPPSANNPSPQNNAANESKSPSEPQSSSNKTNDSNQTPAPEDQAASSPPQTDPPTQPAPQSSQQKAPPKPQAAEKSAATKSPSEEQQAKEQWLKLVPEHPGGLLRQQFLRDHLKRLHGESS